MATWRGLLTAMVLLLGISGCATRLDEPNPILTSADRASLQNECVQIADRSERQACLDRASFAKRW